MDYLINYSLFLFNIDDLLIVYVGFIDKGLLWLLTLSIIDVVVNSKLLSLPIVDYINNPCGDCNSLDMRKSFTRSS